jgi:hypothetical protein
VSPAERLHQWDDAHASVRLELLKFLSDGTEALELPFGTHAIPGLAGRELTRTLDGGIPRCEGSDVGDGREYVRDGPIDLLRERQGCHRSSPLVSMGRHATLPGDAREVEPR